ncbi:MAG TPA: VOC family protein [Steroidobacteraceae bacterium]|jgi:predicted enzyme related to lactoylglutathione lyase|nr:VOC family protein [Steroidobacteraceae bacterium]
MHCIYRRGLTAFLVSALILGNAALARGADFQLPALNSPPSAEHHAGKMVWADLVTPDLATAEKFYGGLFGWTFQPIHAGDINYAVAMLDGRPIGGLVQKAIPAGQHQQSAWLTFLATNDLEGVKKLAVSHGAKVLSDIKSYPMRGRQCVLSDPEGAVFALLASSSGDTPDYLSATGDWIWSSLHAKDAGAEAAFYQNLLGYDVFDLPSDDGLEHLILSTDDYARASANDLEQGSARRHSHWLNFVRVENAAQSAAKAVAMGGRVLVEPRVDRHGGMLAVVADPAGAPVGLMEWSESDTKAEPK